MKKLLASLASLLLLLAGPAGGQERPYPRSQRPRSFLNTGLRLGHCPNYLSTCQSTGGCLTLSRTFDGTSQYFVNVDGGHAAAEIGANKDFAWAGCFYFDGTAGLGRRGLYQNGGGAAAAPGIAIFINTASGNVLQAQMAQGTAVRLDTGASAITVGWHCANVVGDRDGVMEIGLDGVQADATPANIAADAAIDLTNALPLELGRFGATFYWASRIGTPAGLWVGTIGVDVPTFAQLNAQNTTSTAPATCAAWTVAPTACWSFTAAAGANEADQIGAVDLTQINSPGSADGPGGDCN